MSNPEAVMKLAPVIPVLVINDVAHAVPIAQALVAGGLPAVRRGGGAEDVGGLRRPPEADPLVAAAVTGGAEKLPRQARPVKP